MVLVLGRDERTLRERHWLAWACVVYHAWSEPSVHG